MWIFGRELAGTYWRASKRKSVNEKHAKRSAIRYGIFSPNDPGLSEYNVHIDSLIFLIKNNNDWNESAREIYQQQVWTGPYYKAIYSDRTIEQLKNSGNFRLIRDTNVSDAIISYDEFVKNFIITMQDENLLESWRRVNNCGSGIFGLLFSENGLQKETMEKLHFIQFNCPPHLTLYSWINHKLILTLTFWINMLQLMTGLLTMSR
jgi:hypothetical protein